MGWAIYGATRSVGARPKGKPSLQYLARRRKQAAELGLEHGEEPIGPREQARISEERRLEAEQRSERRELEREKRIEERQKRLIEERAEVAGKKPMLTEAKKTAELERRRQLLGLPPSAAPPEEEAAETQVRGRTLRAIQMPAHLGGWQAVPQPEPVGPVPAPVPAVSGGPPALVPPGAPLVAGGLAETMYGQGGISGTALLNEIARRKREARMAQQAAKQEKAAATQKDIKAAERESEIAATILARRPDLSQREFEKLRTSAMTRGMTAAELASEFEAEDKKAEAAQKKRLKMGVAKSVREGLEAFKSARRDPRSLDAFVNQLTQMRDNPNVSPAAREKADSTLKAIQTKYKGRARATPMDVGGGLTPAQASKEYWESLRGKWEPM